MKATRIVFWPGRIVYVCDEHMLKLASLAKTMGFILIHTANTGDEDCRNCVNESKSAKVSE
jgi:hypothetical protein